MAFDIKKMSPIGGQAKRGNAPQLYSYDAGADDISVADYFKPIYAMLSVGDVIMTTNMTTAGSETIGFYGVKAVSATGITLALLALEA